MAVTIAPVTHYRLPVTRSSYPLPARTLGWLVIGPGCNAAVVTDCVVLTIAVTVGYDVCCLIRLYVIRPGLPHSR